MPTTTITLERSAYDLLKSQKRPEESFSQEIRRLLSSGEPKLGTFLQLFPPGSSADLAEAIEEIRREDLAVEQAKLKGGRRTHGRRA